MRLLLEFGATLVAFGLFLSVIGFGLWVIVDVLRSPRAAFTAAGSSKGLWLTLLLVFAVLAFVVVPPLGLGYLVGVRPRVRAAMAQVS